MGNSGELLINIVTIDEPKLLSGSNQKVRGRLSFKRLGYVVTRPPVNRQTLNQSCDRQGTW